MQGRGKPKKNVSARANAAALKKMTPAQRQTGFTVDELSAIQRDLKRQAIERMAG